MCYVRPPEPLQRDPDAVPGDQLQQLQGDCPGSGGSSCRDLVQGEQLPGMCHLYHVVPQIFFEVVQLQHIRKQARKVIVPLVPLKK